MVKRLQFSMSVSDGTHPRIYVLARLSLFVGISLQTLKAQRQKPDLPTLDWCCLSDATSGKRGARVTP